MIILRSFSSPSTILRSVVPETNSPCCISARSAQPDLPVVSANLRARPIRTFPPSVSRPLLLLPCFSYLLFARSSHLTSLSHSVSFLSPLALQPGTNRLSSPQPFLPPLDSPLFLFGLHPFSLGRAPCLLVLCPLVILLGVPCSSSRSSPDRVRRLCCPPLMLRSSCHLLCFSLSGVHFSPSCVFLSPLSLSPSRPCLSLFSS